MSLIGLLLSAMTQHVIEQQTKENVERWIDTVSVTRLRCAKTAELIKVLFGVETLFVFILCINIVILHVSSYFTTTTML